MVTFKDRVQSEINRVEKILCGKVDAYQNVAVEELISYFDGPAPSGDTTTLSDILENQWLFIHELIELSELKKMNLPISHRLFKTHPNEVDVAHITATEYELKFAAEGNDYNWISLRMKDVNSWLEDETMPLNLKIRCEKLIEDYSN
ncbi:MAG: hypothetical protein GPJ54_22010 [Candidatus Heimdallarchaeota archaeon]|nr:hypothetical protein [Candidatus Heimdallarchaeota archaeon]